MRASYLVGCQGTYRSFASLGYRWSSHQLLGGPGENSRRWRGRYHAPQSSSVSDLWVVAWGWCLWLCWCEFVELAYCLLVCYYNLICLGLLIN
jgi:hypothetical protein